MNINMDEKLYFIYEDITESLSRSTHSIRDAELLFWLQVYQLLAQSKIIEKSDAIGIIMYRIKGNNDGCGEVYHLSENRPEAYLQFEQEYHISDVLSELGNHWKQLLCRPSIVHILPFRAWLKNYVDECMPQINRIISEIEAEVGDSDLNQLTEEDFKARQRAYKAYRTRMKKLIEKIDIAKEIYDVRRNAQDIYNTKK